MDCKELKARLEGMEDLGENAGFSLPGDMQTHIEGCPACRGETAALGKSMAWMSLLREEPPQLSPRFWVSFWERQARGVSDFWGVLTILARRTSVALAVLLVLLALSFQFLIPAPDPALAVIETPREYWADAAASGDEAQSAARGREAVVLTLVARTE